jgi:hypothetical protein
MERTEIEMDGVKVNTPEEAYTHALNNIKIEKVVVSIAMNRTNAANRNQNNYFVSVALETGSIYDVVTTAPDVRQSVSKALREKIENAFALARSSIKKEMERDNIPLVNI